MLGYSVPGGFDAASIRPCQEQWRDPASDRLHRHGEWLWDAQGGSGTVESKMPNIIRVYALHEKKWTFWFNTVSMHGCIVLRERAIEVMCSFRIYDYISHEHPLKSFSYTTSGTCFTPNRVPRLSSTMHAACPLEPPLHSHRQTGETDIPQTRGENYQPRHYICWESSRSSFISISKYRVVL